ncbi:MFS general substrate transporter [Eremomyces bilateralis CBS 781.70]|uniref:MFS general substrate transporter n=1 Tax=Eremomyces bilateralis CBS 781.70 TaxID=1392243 RepID=A0A6G1FZ22_9PEZI|nr:MFS general substrate transporter [Eremomyces bilateralis CBS 781.70]KAF1810809.1 MFS general substrate transporter [Eremomyces bilateralis CBS 781.70]
MTKRELPVQQLLILSICRFAEPISLTSIFPYLPEYIESFGIPKDEVGRWTGITSAIYSLSQCVTAIPWGRISDRIGRKPVILMGLVNTMITSLLWGFSGSLPMALVARALAGAGNGNVGILRTVVAELVPYKELQPRAFSIMPLVYNIGTVFGPMIGGALANPLHRQYGDPPSDAFLARYPYSIPNIVSATLFLIGIATGVLFLHETLASRRNSYDWGLALGERVTQFFKDLWHRSRGGETEPLLKHGTGFSSRQSTNLENRYNAQNGEHVQEPNPPWKEVLTTQSIINLIAYTLLAMHSIAYDQLLSVFMHHPVQDVNDPEFQPPFKFAGGFGINSDRIGPYFTLYGIACMLYQFLIFPPVARRYGVLRCFRICSLIFPIVYFISPFATLMPTPLGKQIVLFIFWLFKGLANTFAFPCSTILLTNSATSVLILGTLNGIATTVSAVGRSLGPSSAGSLFTWGVENGYIITPFWYLSAVTVVSAIPTFFLIEGAGFGDDASTTEDDEVGFDADADEEEEDLERWPGSSYDSSGSDDEEATEALGPLLSRESTMSAGGFWRQTGSPVPSSVVASSVVSEEEIDEMESGVVSRRGSSLPGRRGGRTLRRRSSVPIGMGVGFRRMSSNLGQTRSGYGTGSSLGG